MSNCLLHHDTFSHSLAVLARLPVPQRDGWLPSRASVTSRGGFADSGRRIKLLGDCIKCSKASGEASKIGVGVTEIVTLCMWVWVCFFFKPSYRCCCPEQCFLFFCHVYRADGHEKRQGPSPHTPSPPPLHLSTPLTASPTGSGSFHGTIGQPHIHKTDLTFFSQAVC